MYFTVYGCLNSELSTDDVLLISNINYNEMFNNNISEWDNLEKMRLCLKAKAFTSLMMNYMYSNFSTLYFWLGAEEGLLYSITTQVSS
jgi:hypothetical protein